MAGVGCLSCTKTVRSVGRLNLKGTRVVRTMVGKSSGYGGNHVMPGQ